MKFEKISNEFLNETIYISKHKSGLPVVVLKKPDFKKFYSVISTKYGSNNAEFSLKGDKEYISIPDGTAHFLEHKLFEQPDGTNAFDKFSLLGANANAFTSFSNTAYLFSATSDFYESLNHLLSYVFTPYFTKENVDKEQGIIAQEIGMYDDDPEWKVFFNMLRGMYVKHPVRKDIAGTVESISQITDKILYDAYNVFYHPENMVLFMAGNIELESLEKILDENVKVRDEGFNAVIKEINEPDSINESYISEKLSVSIPMFCCGYKDINNNLTGKELAKKSLITSITVKLFASDSSPLYQKLYDSGLINDSFYDDVTLDKDYGFIQFGGESENPDEVMKHIKAEAERISREGFLKEDFERIKNMFYGKYIKSFNNVEAVGNSFCSNYFLGIGLFDFLEIYDTITIDDINDGFKKLFCEDRFVMSVINPV